MSTKRRFFSGKTVDQALLMAASHYKLEPNQIGYREREKRRGVAKSRKAVVIEVDPDNLSVAPGSPAPVVEERTAEPTTPLPSAEMEVHEEEKETPLEQPWTVEAAPAEPAESTEPAELSEEPMAEAPAVATESSDVGEDVAVDVAIEGAVDFTAEDGMITLPEASAASGPPVSAPPGLATPPPARVEDDERPPAPRRRRSRRRSASRSKDEDHPKASQEEVFAAARENVALLIRLAGLELSVEVSEGDERLEIDLSGPDIEDALAEDGEVLEAVEYLTPRMMRASLGYLVPCRVDGDGFRQERDEELVRLAKSMATKVRESGRSKTLEPMNPADRRLIHVSLAEEPGVVTESVGDGFFKRVSIRPE